MNDIIDYRPSLQLLVVPDREVPDHPLPARLLPAAQSFDSWIPQWPRVILTASDLERQDEEPERWDGLS